jgi:hypothetical protein
VCGVTLHHIRSSAFTDGHGGAPPSVGMWLRLSSRSFQLYADSFYTDVLHFDDARHDAVHALQMCHTREARRRTDVTNVSHPRGTTLYRRYKCVTPARHDAVQALQMCQTRVARCCTGVTNVSHSRGMTPYRHYKICHIREA